MENSVENSSEKQMGPPRLPQAIIITARKVAAVTTMPSSSSSWRTSCTSMKSGAPSSGAGSICMILRRRGAGTSGRLVIITPTAAVEAAASPAASKMASMMSTRPSETRQAVGDVLAQQHMQAFLQPALRPALQAGCQRGGGGRVGPVHGVPGHTLPKPIRGAMKKAREAGFAVLFRTGRPAPCWPGGPRP
jgi:hypothetical protein